MRRGVWRVEESGETNLVVAEGGCGDLQEVLLIGRLWGWEASIEDEVCSFLADDACACVGCVLRALMDAWGLVPR